MRDIMIKADPKTTARKVREEAEGMTKEELVAELVSMAPDARKSHAGSLPTLAVGSAIGSAAGEAVNAGLYQYAKSTLPLAGTVAKYYPTLRYAPHMALSAAAMIAGRTRESVFRAGLFAAGVGLAGPAIARFIDTQMHAGDLAAAEEQALRLEVEGLRRQVAAAGGKK